MFVRMRKRMKSQKGFTLIELLVVIIIIAILAAIAIPTFLGQRQKAQDAAAKSLVRNAMTTLESAYVDGRTYVVTPAALALIEPAIKWPTAMNTAHVATATTLPVADTILCNLNQVDYFGTANTFSVATTSASGNKFGVFTDKTATGGTTFAKIVGGTFGTGW